MTHSKEYEEVAGWKKKNSKSYLRLSHLMTHSKEYEEFEGWKKKNSKKRAKKGKAQHQLGE